MGRERAWAPGIPRLPANLKQWCNTVLKHAATSLSYSGQPSVRTCCGPCRDPGIQIWPKHMGSHMLSTWSLRIKAKGTKPGRMITDTGGAAGMRNKGIWPAWGRGSGKALGGSGSSRAFWCWVRGDQAEMGQGEDSTQKGWGLSGCRAHGRRAAWVNTVKWEKNTEEAKKVSTTKADESRAQRVGRDEAVQGTWVQGSLLCGVWTLCSGPWEPVKGLTTHFWREGCRASCKTRYSWRR